jgi:1,4-alpha-glucan branching enzyme
MRSETVVKSKLGATYPGNGRCQFLVWTPNAKSVGVRLFGNEAQTELPMEPLSKICSIGSPNFTSTRSSGCL